MSTHPSTPDHLPILPANPNDHGIGIVGAGFIVRDCHLVAYADAGFKVVGLTSRTESTAWEVAQLRGVPKVFDSVEAMLENPEVTVVDVAVPPLEQPGVIRRILAHPRRPRGILAQKPLAMTLDEGKALVEACESAGVHLQVNQNMRYDHSVRVLKGLLDRGDLGEPVLATIEMRAIPHWMPWAEGGRSLSTFIMSIHHLDTFRYWLGDPIRVLASTRPDPRTKFVHEDGINLSILEYASGARASAWDDVWSGPSREGAGAEFFVRWRVEGTKGLALGTIGWPGWPERVPSTIDFSTTLDNGDWHRPRWVQSWFPDAFVGTMAGLLRAIETNSEPDISGRDHLNTLALCEAVLTAGREHRVVTMGGSSKAAT
jgi:predicted dehydrogenase